MAYLEIEGPGDEIQRFPIGSGALVIGRSASADIQIDDQHISRRHASIAEGFLVRDMDSSNGVYFRGRQIREEFIPAEEPFQLGSYGRYRLTIRRQNLEADEETTGAAQTEHVQLSPEERAQIELARQSPPAPAPLAPAPPAGQGGKKSESDRGAEVAALEAEIAKLQAEVDMLRPYKQQTEALQTENEALENENARLSEQVDSLRRKVLQAQAESAAQAEFVVQAAPTAAPPQAVVPVGPAGDMNSWLTALFGSDAPEPEKLLASKPQLVVEDFQFILGSLYSFSRDLERVVTRLAQSFQGVRSPELTILPGASVNLSSRVISVLGATGPEGRQSFDRYMEDLRGWTVSVLGAYKRGVENWAVKFLRQMSPTQLRKQVNLTRLQRIAGMEYQELWKEYERIIRDLSPEIIVDQVEEAAAEAAEKLSR